MTGIKTHSMTLKDGDGTKIEIETLKPECSASGWVCCLALSLTGDKSLSVHLTSEEAVKLGTALVRIVAENSRRQK